MGTMAYHLMLPASTSIHPVFDISQVKKSLGTHQVLQITPPLLTENFEWLIRPQVILDVHNQSSKGGPEVLVRLEGPPTHEAT